MIYVYYHIAIYEDSKSRRLEGRQGWVHKHRSDDVCTFYVHFPLSSPMDEERGGYGLI